MIVLITAQIILLLFSKIYGDLYFKCNDQVAELAIFL